MEEKITLERPEKARNYTGKCVEYHKEDGWLLTGKYYDALPNISINCDEKNTRIGRGPAYEFSNYPVQITKKEPLTFYHCYNSTITFCDDSKKKLVFLKGKVTPRMRKYMIFSIFMVALFMTGTWAIYMDYQVSLGEQVEAVQEIAEVNS